MKTRTKGRKNGGKYFPAYSILVKVLCKVWFPFSVRTHQGEGASLPPRCRRGPSVWTSLEHPPLRLSPLPIECSGPLIFFMERCWGKVYTLPYFKRICVTCITSIRYMNTGTLKKGKSTIVLLQEYHFKCTNSIIKVVF